MMKGPAGVAVYAVLVALAASFLFQVSDCSRASPEEEPRRAPAVPHPVLRDAAAAVETGTRPAGAEVEDAEGTVAGVAASSATAASARVKQVGHPDGGVGSSSWGSALTMRPPVLPRRFLSGAPPVGGAADSAARSSCHSSDVHISCGPPSRN